MQALHRAVELVVPVGGAHGRVDPPRRAEDPLVERRQGVGRDRMPRRVEVGEAAEQVARGVADAAVGLGGAVEDLVRHRELRAGVGARHPQPQHVRAEAVDHPLRLDHVAARLRHLAARGVDHEAVRQHRPVGRAAVERGRGQQRGLEPAAVLVGALQVQVGRRAAERGVGRQHGAVGAAGIEPHVERVRGLHVVGGGRAQQLLGLQIEPGVDAALLDAFGDPLQQRRRVRVQPAAVAAPEQRDRRAPGALAADAPVRAGFEHAAHAFAAPPGMPVDRRRRRQRPLAQAVVQAHEPLFRGAEEQRRVVAPAVRVAVRVVAPGEQRPVAFEPRGHRRRRLVERQAREPVRGIGVEAAVRPHRAGGRQAVRLAHREVLRPVRGRGVHAAGALVGGDVAGGEQRHPPR